MNQFLQHQLWIANATPHYFEKRGVFYPLKDKLLKRFGESDGWDLQVIVKDCWDCEGTGKADWWYEEGDDDCESCYGTGEYSRREYCLLRYRLGDRIYHRPVDICEANELNIAVPSEKRSVISGRITHGSYDLSPLDGERALKWMLLRYQPKTLIAMVWRNNRPRWIGRLIRKCDRWVENVLIQRFNLQKHDDIPF